MTALTRLLLINAFSSLDVRSATVPRPSWVAEAGAEKNPLKRRWRSSLRLLLDKALSDVIFP